MGASIYGLGTALPQHAIEQRDAAEVARTFVCAATAETRALPALFRRTQVRQRSSVLLEPPNGDRVCQSFYPPAADAEDAGPTTAARMGRYAKEAGPLALAAARKALVAACIEPADITHSITVSCTGFFAPGVDISLVRQLGMRPTVGRVQVGFMGCHGAINGLRAAQAFVEADPSARVLLCAVELCSLHYQYGLDPQSLVANALFADGAAAMVVGPVTGDDRWRLLVTGSCIIPDAADAMTWTIGNHGFQMTLSPQVPNLICRHLRPWLEPWIRSHDYRLDQIGCWAVHPGGPRILSSVADALSLSPSAMDASAAVLAECGNMSSPTVLFVLKRLQEADAARPCVALGFGPGLIVEAAILA